MQRAVYVLPEQHFAASCFKHIHNRSGRMAGAVDCPDGFGAQVEQLSCSCYFMVNRERLQRGVVPCRRGNAGIAPFKEGSILFMSHNFTAQLPAEQRGAAGMVKVAVREKQIINRGTGLQTPFDRSCDFPVTVAASGINKRCPVFKGDKIYRGIAGCRQAITADLKDMVDNFYRHRHNYYTQPGWLFKPVSALRHPLSAGRNDISIVQVLLSIFFH